LDLRRLVLVFARTPRDEAAAKPLGARAQAERLHRVLLDRALAAAVAAGFHTRLVTPGDAPEIPDGVEVVPQRGGSFGERLEHAVGDAFADGWRQVVVIGADAPRLDAARIREAFARLSASGARAVIGPARDGGYYLLGLTRHDASLFRAIPFCTRGTFAATVGALAAARFAIATLPPLDDVDTLDDVRRLASASGRLAQLARDLLALATAPVCATAVAPPPPRAAAFVDARGPPPRSAALF
jgi:glycosyltransferase A (GT-A) superfamily protein (DUF2064 family)